MNRNEFGIFIKKNFNGIYNPGRQEWRFNNGDRVYTLDTKYTVNALTFEPHLSNVKMFERSLRTGENAADDVPGRSTEKVKYIRVGELAGLTVDQAELKSWIVKAILTHEFK